VLETREIAAVAKTYGITLYTATPEVGGPS